MRDSPEDRRRVENTRRAAVPRSTAIPNHLCPAASMSLRANPVMIFTTVPNFHAPRFPVRIGATMNVSWDIPSLPDLANHIWSVLTEASGSGPHPWRTPVLATVGAWGPSARTVVLRGFTRPGFELIAFSDARSAKISELLGRSEAAWLFYDPTERVQLRARTEIRIHRRDPVAQTYWHRLPPEQRGLYLSRRSPGEVIERPDGANSLIEGDEQQFAVLIGTVQELDWLWLGPAGHRRAVFLRGGTEWQGRWVEP